MVFRQLQYLRWHIPGAVLSLCNLHIACHHLVVIVYHIETDSLIGIKCCLRIAIICPCIWISYLRAAQGVNSLCWQLIDDRATCCPWLTCQVDGQCLAVAIYLEDKLSLGSRWQGLRYHHQCLVATGKSQVFTSGNILFRQIKLEGLRAIDVCPALRGSGVLAVLCHQLAVALIRDAHQAHFLQIGTRAYHIG